MRALVVVALVLSLAARADAQAGGGGYGRVYKPGEIHVPWPPQQSVDARAGDFVLAPSKNSLDMGFMSKTAQFLYAMATMVTPGPYESVIRDTAGKEYKMANSLIIPIHSGTKARVGDVVLTQFASKPQMERAYVVGGTADEPEVYYMDIKYEDPTGWGKKTDKLKRGQFQKISQPWEIGTAAACKEGSKYRTGRIVNASGNDLLVLDDNGAIVVKTKAICKALPIVPSVQAGEKVQVEHLGYLKDAVVDKVDDKLGRVFTTVVFVGKKNTVVVSFGDVLPLN